MTSEPASPGRNLRIAPCLWFDDDAEAAANHYVEIFPNSRIVAMSRYGEAAASMSGKAPGSVMTVDMELDGHRFTALNGGPQFRFNEAVSFQVMCESQDEIDHYWNRLSEGGEGGPCGWLKDRFGVSWQVVPAFMAQAMAEADDQTRERIMAAVLSMSKIDLDAVRAAYEGGG